MRADITDLDSVRARLAAEIPPVQERPPVEAYEEAPTVFEPLLIDAASTWADRPPPAMRDWVIPDILPAGRVTSMLGNGGLGKTLLAVQLAVHTAISQPIFGKAVNGGPVIGIFCEDEAEELERRARAACDAEGIDLAALDQLYVLSRDGQDNLLCTFDHEQIVLTRFYGQLDATLARIKPRLLILDTAADLFGGDFMSTPQVRQFLKVALGGLSVRHGCAILLLAHPSASGMASGDGGGFSTAWNNSVRSRLYLRRPKTEDEEAAKDRRILEVRKANYAADGTSIALVYQNGAFAPDLEPIEDGTAKTPRVRAGGCTKLGMAVMTYMHKTAPAGQVVGFRSMFEALQAAGNIQAGDYESVRKPLQRTLSQLTDEQLIEATKVPRGYRLKITKSEAP